MGGGEGSINEGFKPNTSVLNISDGVCINNKGILTNVLRAMVNNTFKESFYEKKIINVLIIFSISPLK